MARAGRDQGRQALSSRRPARPASRRAAESAPVVAPVPPKAVPAADVIAAVRPIAEPIVKSRGLELDRIEYLDRGRSAVLRVFIDRPDGVDVEDCAEVSRELSPALDVHDVVPKAFTLEVSSPGLDRPLRDEDDFRRFAGRPASLTLRRAMEGGSKLVGLLRGVEDGQVALELEDGRVVKVGFDLVAKARLEPEAGAAGMKGGVKR